MYVSAGKVGYQIELAQEDLARVVGCGFEESSLHQYVPMYIVLMIPGITLLINAFLRGQTTMTELE